MLCKLDQVESFCSLKLSATELMQKRRPVGLGPSVKTCPRCPSHRLHKTSVLRIPKLVSVFISRLFLEIGAVKLGQPVPESNFVSEENSLFPQPAHTYIPFFLLRRYFPVNGRSVPFSLSTCNSSGVKAFLHSSSDFFVFCFKFITTPKCALLSTVLTIAFCHKQLKLLSLLDY